MLVSSRSQAILGELSLPGDKSISHRSVILASLAEGTSWIHNFLMSEDCMHTLRAMQALGVSIHLQDTVVKVNGVGLKGFKQALNPIECGNSGTSMRLLAGLLAGMPFASTLVGDASLSKRPMERIINPLRIMGASIDGTPLGQHTCSPLHIYPSTKLRAIDYQLPIASAQVKSCLLLAGLFAQGKTRVTEPSPSRDHSERMLQAFGIPLERDHLTVSLTPQALVPTTIEIPGDFSSAAFFIVAATLIPGSKLTLQNIGINPTRTGLIELLKQMGANITVTPYEGYEPVGELLVEYAPLKGIVIPEDLIVSALDEFPILFIAAAFAEGETILRNAPELRVKESDRLQAMAENLSACGVSVQLIENGIVIQGGGFRGGIVESFGDHRVAMAFLIAGCLSNEPVVLHDGECIATSFPHFIELANQLDLNISRKYQ